MDLIAYWNVVQRQRRVVVIGLCVAAALALFALVKPTASGLTWRTPPVYDATTTLLVTKPGFREGTVGNPTADLNTSTYLEGLASLYTRLAQSYVIERAAGKKLGIEKPEYDAAPLAGVEGRALPLVQITAYETTPDGAVALANGVSNALRSFISRGQENNRISGKNRVELQVVEPAQEAEVFRGVRLTRPIMLFLLVALLTVGAAFVVDNFGGGRRSAQAQGSPEPEATLGIVRDEPRRSPTNEAQAHEEEDDDPVREVAARIQPASPENEEAISEASSARGRWARPS